MLLRDIFVKPIDRPIEGVIKADDESGLLTEFEEYVLTPEVSRHLEQFLDAYNDYEGANGVWISGFFGSGKSHLLKILSYLLENRAIDGTTALDIFLPKCEDNELMKGAIRKAVSIPSKSVLFNIDQRANVISKTQVDALLSVFMKVFDDMCGYCGKLGYVAQFERDLDEEGLYEEFKAAYRDVDGSDWAAGRERPVIKAKKIAKAYARVTGVPDDKAHGVLEKYRSGYGVSIEDFAELVKKYIDGQGRDFRLNFFVDEVGQYIAGNVKLMTNLQTIAESLATRCKGRAWIIVTAQEDMNTVVGEMNKRQSNDFSKIQARFANKLHLTSTNVEKVIQKRLLDKNDTGKSVLSGIYEAQRNNFRTLFDFADGQTYHNYRDEGHFLDSYPFVPYQYPLFQVAIQSLSEHNAFEGRYSSIGERSMLGVFREVAVKLADRKVGDLASFDLMFEGIRAVLKGTVQAAVQRAEQHLDHDPFAVRTLKALFLVKYVREFKATVRNLCVLLLDRFDANMAEFQREVERALNLLEQQNYIERNGEEYQFLTNEEKDVEEEIKNTDLDADLVAEELQKVVFSRVLGLGTKYRYDGTGQDFPVAKKVDGRLYGRAQELAVHVISPFHEQSGEDAAMSRLSMVGAELILAMDNDSRLIKDLQLYLKTEKYVNQRIGQSENSSIENILRTKQARNHDRHKTLVTRITELMGHARVYVHGEELPVNAHDPKTRLDLGFDELVKKNYPNLRMLGDSSYDERNVDTILSASPGLLDPGDDLEESEREILGFITRSQTEGVRVTVKTLLETFEKKPYGWPYSAALCILAHLCARGKVECTADSLHLEGRDLARALRNTQTQSKIILKCQAQFSPAQVTALKRFHQDFFDDVPGNGDPRKLAGETAHEMVQLAEELERYLNDLDVYPFLAAIKDLPDRLRTLASRNYDYLLTNLSDFEDLLDLKDDLIAPIRQFMSGQQKVIYDEARTFLRREKPNLTYLSDEEPTRKLELLEEILNSPGCFRGRGMTEARELLESLKTALALRIGEEKQKVSKEMDGLWQTLTTMKEYEVLDESERQQLQSSFETEKQALLDQALIAVLRERFQSFNARGFQELLNRMLQMAYKPVPPKPNPPVHPPVDPPGKEPGGDGGPGTGGGDGGGDGKGDPGGEERVNIPDRVVSADEIQPAFGKTILQSEEEVRDYLKALEEAFMAKIRANCRIRLF